MVFNLSIFPLSPLSHARKEIDNDLCGLNRDLESAFFYVYWCVRFPAQNLMEWNKGFDSRGNESIVVMVISIPTWILGS